MLFGTQVIVMTAVKKSSTTPHHSFETRQLLLSRHSLLEAIFADGHTYNGRSRRAERRLNIGPFKWKLSDVWFHRSPLGHIMPDDPTTQPRVIRRVGRL